MPKPSSMKSAFIFTIPILFFKAVAFPSLSLLLWMIIAMVLDFITGIIKAVLQNKVRTSSGYRKSVIKIIQYLGSIGICVILNHSAKENGYIDVQNILKWLNDGLLIFIIYIEVTSIFENLYAIDGNSTFAKFFIKPILNLLTFQLKNNPVTKAADAQKVLMVALSFAVVACNTTKKSKHSYKAKIDSTYVNKVDSQANTTVTAVTKTAKGETVKETWEWKFPPFPTVTTNQTKLDSPVAGLPNVLHLPQGVLPTSITYTKEHSKTQNDSNANTTTAAGSITKQQSGKVTSSVVQSDSGKQTQRWPWWQIILAIGLLCAGVYVAKYVFDIIVPPLNIPDDEQA